MFEKKDKTVKKGNCIRYILIFVLIGVASQTAFAQSLLKSQQRTNREF